MSAPSGVVVKVDVQPSEALLLRAADWLSVRCHENLGAEMLIRGRARRPITFVHVAQRGDGNVAGVSLLSRTRGWYLEGADAVTTRALVEAMPDPPPVRLTTAASVREWALAAFEGRWRVVRHQRLLSMTCAGASGGEGRWATEKDLPVLTDYQERYNAERLATMQPNWIDAVARKQVAVLERDARAVALVKRSGETARYACIGGTYTYPEYRNQALGRKLTAFMVERLLEECPRVHLIVDDDNVPAITMYRTLDFGEIGECFVDFLEK